MRSAFFLSVALAVSALAVPINGEARAQTIVSHVDGVYVPLQAAVAIVRGRCAGKALEASVPDGAADVIVKIDGVTAPPTEPLRSSGLLRIAKVFCSKDTYRILVAEQDGDKPERFHQLYGSIR
jgi:hypothetical protein